MDTLDLLIARALQSGWGKAEPSSRVWHRIRRQIAARPAPNIPTRDFYLAPYWTPAVDTVFPFPSAGSLVLWRYDLALSRFA